MTKVKKWQCPHCPQDSPRHWNAVVHIKRKHGGVGAPLEKGNLSQHSNTSPGSGGRSIQNVKHTSQYNCSNYLYTNRANKGSKGDEDVIDKWYQMVLEQEEKERKIRKIKEFYCRNPDAPMPIPNIDTSNLPVKNTLEQSLPKISCQNVPKNNPSSQIQGLCTLLIYLTYTTHKGASQNTGRNSPSVAFPRLNRDTHPQFTAPMNHTSDNDDDDDRSGIYVVKRDDIDDRGFKITWTIKYNSIGDIMDASHTDGLYEYMTEQERLFEKRQHKSSSL